MYLYTIKTWCVCVCVCARVCVLCCVSRRRPRLLLNDVCFSYVLFGRSTTPSYVKEGVPVDPNEPTYCVCNRVSFGEMIACENETCAVEWFHFACVGLSTDAKIKVRISPRPPAFSFFFTFFAFRLFYSTTCKGSSGFAASILPPPLPILPSASHLRPSRGDDSFPLFFFSLSCLNPLS